MPYVYARVSSARQNTDGNLDRQVDRLVHALRSRWGNKHPYHLIKEYGSGLNPQRSGLQRLIHAVQAHKVSQVLVTYKDRLTRYGFPFLMQLFQIYQVSIVEIDQEPNSPPDTQLMNNLMALLAVFLGKFYKHRALRYSGPHHINDSEQICIDCYLEKYTHSLIKPLISQVLVNQGKTRQMSKTQSSFTKI